MTTETDRPLPFDIIAFAFALVLAPVAVTAVSFFLLIPIFALVLGGPVYLMVGTPVLLWMVGRYPPNAKVYATAGLAANIALCLFVVIADKLIPAAREAGIGNLLGSAAFGLFFGPIWAGAFASLYRRFNRMARLVPQS